MFNRKYIYQEGSIFEPPSGERGLLPRFRRRVGGDDENLFLSVKTRTGNKPWCLLAFQVLMIILVVNLPVL